jgi:four helix bundle protein
MSKVHFRFEDLHVYNKAIQYGELVNITLDQFPQKEIYRLTSQFARAADSIALNIAEGSSSTDKNFVRYLGMSRDSAHECVAIVTKAQLRNYLNLELVETHRENLVELCKMITSLIRHLKQKE